MLVSKVQGTGMKVTKIITQAMTFVEMTVADDMWLVAPSTSKTCISFSRDRWLRPQIYAQRKRMESRDTASSDLERSHFNNFIAYFLQSKK